MADTVLDLAFLSFDIAMAYEVATTGEVSGVTSAARRQEYFEAAQRLEEQ